MSGHIILALYTSLVLSLYFYTVDGKVAMHLLRVIFLVIKVVSAHFLLPPKGSDKVLFEDDVAPRLLVSEYIKAGKIEEARIRSLVTGLEPNVTSYSGFFTVNEQCGSNMFYWFFPSQNDWENDPVTVWLEGGPGTTALIGALLEHGPLALNVNNTLTLREIAWNRNSSMLYIDNPVGTGFSYTEKDECYSSDESQVGQNLLSAVEQFFLLFPELQSNPFFIAGESYGGKFVPALGHAIHHSDSNINLQGLAIGNGMVDPINQLKYSDLLYQLGMVDENYRNFLSGEESNIRNLIDMGEYAKAHTYWQIYLGLELGPKVGYEAFYNFLYTTDPISPDIIDVFVNSSEVREAMHVGNATWNGWSTLKVYEVLQADFMMSIRPWFEELVEHYRVILYSGQLDIICAYTLTVDFLQKMEWSGAEEYKTAQRKNWYVGDELAGYAKTVKNLTEVLIRNQGHVTASDQPKWNFDLYTKLISNQPF